MSRLIMGLDIRQRVRAFARVHQVPPGRRPGRTNDDCQKLDEQNRVAEMSWDGVNRDGDGDAPGDIVRPGEWREEYWLWKSRRCDGARWRR